MVRASKQSLKPTLCSSCESPLSQSSPGMLGRDCLEGRRARCKSCGSDVSALWELCVDCQRTKASGTQERLAGQRRHSGLPEGAPMAVKGYEHSARTVEAAASPGVERALVEGLRARADEFAVKDSGAGSRCKCGRPFKRKLG